MSLMNDLLFVALIILHTLDGREVVINSKQITSLTGPRPGAAQGMFVEGSNCLINMTDGKFVAVVETCNQVRDLLEAAK